MKAFFSVFIAAVCAVILSGCMLSPLHQAILYNDNNKAVSLLEHGEKVDERNPAGNTPLIMAIFKGNVPLTKYLISKGADVNAVGKFGNTPLLIAIKSPDMYRYQIATLLIQRGANVNSIDKYGYSALSYALHMDEEGSYGDSFRENCLFYSPCLKKDFVKLLLANGADMSIAYAKDNSDVEQKRQDKADSRAFWKGAATLATGVAVGKATSGYSPDQQTRMMKSSMKAVDSGDTSELTETTNQVKEEQAQSHKAKMQAIEAQKERDRAAAQRAQEDERNNQAQRKLQQSQAQPRNAPLPSAGSRGGLAETSQQDQERQRKELQAQLNAKQQSRNRNEEQLQQQAQQNNREQGQRNRQSGNTNIAGLSGNNGSAAPSTGAGKKVVHGPEQLEAVAVCWQSKQKKENWRCDGPTQLTILGDSLENALGYSGCRPYRTTDGDRTITLRGGESASATVYVCGWGIWTEYDIAKKYGIVVQRNKYQCDNGPKSHCKENFQLTD